MIESSQQRQALVPWFASQDKETLLAHYLPHC